jgi:hypothetical protein
MSPTEKRLAARVKKYGITVEQFREMARRQGGVCALCSLPPKVKPLEIDHDHRTGRVRGLLCWWDNKYTVGGRLNSPVLHLKAANYLASKFDGRSL